MNPTQRAAVDVTATVSRTLRDAASYLARHGWIQGCYYDQTATVFTPAACLVGAIGMVCYGGPVDAPALNFDDPGFDDFEAAVAWLEDFLGRAYDADVYEFNDAKGRTADQVIAALNAAADRWDSDQARVPHADYPHEPGTLYDCPACEAACFCADGFVCIHCAILAEGATSAMGGAV